MSEFVKLDNCGDFYYVCCVDENSRDYGWVFVKQSDNSFIRCRQAKVKELVELKKSLTEGTITPLEILL